MIPDYREKMGLELKVWRTRARLTQKRLGEKLSCSGQEIYAWEIGKRPIPIKYFIQLPNILGCNLDDLNPIPKESTSENRKTTVH